MLRAPVEGGEIEYRVVGSAEGEPVLLIHGGIFADGLASITAEPALGAYRFILYHRRGYAGSTKVEPPFRIEDQAADARALLNYLGIARAHVVGSSYGGAIAMQLAADAPELIQTLTLMDPAVLQTDPSTDSVASPPEPLERVLALYWSGDAAGALDAMLTVVNDAVAEAIVAFHPQ